MLAPRGRWDKDDDLRQDGLTEMLWATVDDDEDGFDAMAASLNKRVGNLPQVSTEKKALTVFLSHFVSHLWLVDFTFFLVSSDCTSVQFASYLVPQPGFLSQSLRLLPSRWSTHTC